MVLTKKLIKTVPREKSGSNTSNAYDYQKNWALCFLLQCHETMKDYLLILDYHDDIVLFDSETKPTKAAFYQVKTKRASVWKLHEITSAKSGSMSIIGKMYDNKAKFKCNVNSINMVSNASYDFELNSKGEDCKSKVSICAKELDKNSVTKLAEAIKRDHKLTKKPPFEKITFFQVTELSIDGHPTHALGIMTEFLEKAFPGQKHAPSPLYKTLFGEISRRTNYAKDISSYAEDLKKKSLGKTYVDSILSQVAVKKNFADVWKSVELVLVQEKYNVIGLRNLKNSWDRLEIDFLDHTNMALQRLFLVTKNIVNDVVKNNALALTEIMQQSLDSIKLHHRVPSYMDDNYLRAIVLAAFHE